MRRAATMISDRRFLLAFVFTLLFAVLMLVPASPAYADIADDVNAWLSGLLRDACNWMFTNQVAVLSSIGYDGIIGADFSQMLTTAGDVSMYDIARGVWDVAVLPIGCGVLGLVFTVKLIQISQRMDGNASFPGVKEVVFLLVFFAVFLFLIQNSFELMEAVYAVVGLAIDRTMSLFGSGGAIDLTAVSVVTEDDDVPALIALLLVSVISWVVVPRGLHRGARGLLGARHPALRHGGVQPDPALAHGPRRHAPDRHRLPEELHRGVPGGAHHPDPADCLPAHLGRPHRGEHLDGNAHRRDSDRAHLRASVPGDVRAFDPLARQERRLGTRHRIRGLIDVMRKHLKGGGRLGRLTALRRYG